MASGSSARERLLAVCDIEGPDWEPGALQGALLALEAAAEMMTVHLDLHSEKGCFECGIEEAGDRIRALVEEIRNAR